MLVCEFYEGLGFGLSPVVRLRLNVDIATARERLATVETSEGYAELLRQLSSTVVSVPPGRTPAHRFTFAGNQTWEMRRNRWANLKHPETEVLIRTCDWASVMDTEPTDCVRQEFSALGWTLSPKVEELMPGVLAEVAGQLIRASLHLKETATGYCATEVDSTEQFRVRALQDVLKRLRPMLKGLSAQYSETSSQPLSFDLLWWSCDHLGDFCSGHRVDVESDEDTPFFLGQPLPREVRPPRVTLSRFEGVLGRRLKHGLALLESCLDQYENLRWAVLRQWMFDQGRPAWGFSPGGSMSVTHDWQTACAQNFERVRRLLSQKWMEQ